jgi:acetolactate synthase-1/2/3 large subunit
VKLAETIVDAVGRHGADTVFGVPGGGPNLAMIGAAEAAGLRFVLSHGETSGAITAATYGLLTGRPAMAIATRGPGAASAVNGAAQATLDRYPLLLVTDCVTGDDRERVAHQRLDQVALLGTVTKWSGSIGEDAAAPSTASAALQLAAAAPRGAVHLDFDPGSTSGSPPAPPTRRRSGSDVRDRARAMIAAATHPVAVAGFECIADPDAVRSALERLGCPVLVTYQAIGLLPEGHPQAAGLYTNGAIERDLLSRADLVVTVGLDTVEPMPTPWGLDAPVLTISNEHPVSTFVPTTLELVGPLADVLADLAGSAAHRWEHDAGASALRQARTALSAAKLGTFGPVELATTVARLTPAGATATVDAGAHFLAIMPFWPVPSPLGLLISNGLATMGFSLPAAIGAALARPDTPIVCLVGDGGLGMTLAELETVARLRLPVTVVVFDDAGLSLIDVKRQVGQGGVDAVRYAPIDFAGIARAVGLDAVVVESTADVERALDGGWERPRLVDARIDPSPYAALISATRG